MPERLTPFAFEEQLVRCRLDEHGEPWFVAKDVCRVLGLENNRDAVSSLDEDEKITVGNPDSNPRAGIPHQYTLISESGLYALIFRSRKPQARAFSKWVRAEVLPSLRRTGRYALPEAGEEAPDLPAIPEMYALRPTMRQRLWQDALQTARLDNGGSAAAVRWFARLCRMVTARPVDVREPGRECAARILRFADEECRRDAGGRVNASRLYEAFALWWCAHFADTVPAIHVFGRVMPARFAKVKRGGKTWYLGLSLSQ